MPDPAEYTIGWICTFGIESIATQAFLDKVHEPPVHLVPHDENRYIFGRVGGHYIVTFPTIDGGDAVQATKRSSIARPTSNVQ